MSAPGEIRLPDRTAPELQRLVQQLWSHGTVRVVIGESAPPGYRVVEQYLAAPNLERARMLLPALSQRARSKALSQYNQLRRGRVRASRALLAPAARTGLDRRLIRAVVSVCVPADATLEQLADELPTQRLTQVLGRGRLHAAIGVANPSPNRKPTLQLFDDAGTPIAFVKVGWNGLTRDMVETESTTLERLAAANVVTPRRPRRLGLERWHDMVLLATEPMPLALRRQSSADCPTIDLRVEATSDSSANTDPLELVQTPFWTRLEAKLQSLHAPDQVPSEQAIVAKALQTLAFQAARTPIDHLPWHGDWVHWNMASFRGELWVWDWEHFADDAPRCFDALHFWFQHEFVIRRRTFGEAMQHAIAMTASARAKQFASNAADLIPIAYVLEVYHRAARMAELGASWEDRFHAPSVQWLADATANG
jgi:hypothetical protein